MRLRKSTFFFGAVSILSLIITLAVTTNVRSRYINLLSQKESYLNTLLTAREAEKKLAFLTEKGSVFANFLKNDVNFLPYYRLLQSYLLASTSSANIDHINYDNQRNAEIVLIFSDYQNLYDSLQRLEDENFLNIFDNLTLDSFAISEGKTKNYQLTLKGRFKPL